MQCNKTFPWQSVIMTIESVSHLFCLCSRASQPSRRAFRKYSINIMLKSCLKEEAKQQIFLISTFCHTFPHFIQSRRLFYIRSTFLQCLCTLDGNIFLSHLRLSHRLFCYFGPLKAMMKNPGSSWEISQMQMLCRFPWIPQPSKNRLFANVPFQDTAKISNY